MSSEPDYSDEQAWCLWYDALTEDEQRIVNKRLVAEERRVEAS